MSRVALKFGAAAGVLILAAWIFLPTSPPSKREEFSPNPQLSQLPVSPTSAAPIDKAKAVHPSIRQVSSSEGSAGIAELEAESSLRWSFKKDPASGLVTKMSEGRLSFSSVSPELAVLEFLDRYGRKVLGFSPGSAGEPEVIREEQSTQVIVPQSLNGLPVYGARANFIFDPAGNLIYAVSDVYRGPSPPPPVPAFSHSHSAQVARQALLHYLQSADPSSYPDAVFQGHLMYRMVGASVSLVYRFELPLAAPLVGDMEILVDASMGVAVLVRNQSRK